MASQSRQVESPQQLSTAMEPEVCQEEFGSNQARASRVQASDLTDRTASVRGAVRDLGAVAGLDRGFTGTAGAVLDALMPSVGDKGKVQINVNVPVDQTGTVRVGFEFVAEAERDGSGVRGRIQVGGGVTASKTIDAYLMTVEAFA